MPLTKTVRKNSTCKRSLRLFFSIKYTHVKYEYLIFRSPSRGHFVTAQDKFCTSIYFVMAELFHINFFWFHWKYLVHSLHVNRYPDNLFPTPEKFIIDGIPCERGFKALLTSVHTWCQRKYLRLHWCQVLHWVSGRASISYFFLFFSAYSYFSYFFFSNFLLFFLFFSDFTYNKQIFVRGLNILSLFKYVVYRVH